MHPQRTHKRRQQKPVTGPSQRQHEYDPWIEPLYCRGEWSLMPSVEFQNWNSLDAWRISGTPHTADKPPKFGSNRPPSIYSDPYGEWGLQRQRKWRKFWQARDSNLKRDLKNRQARKRRFMAQLGFQTVQQANQAYSRLMPYARVLNEEAGYEKYRDVVDYLMEIRRRMVLGFTTWPRGSDMAKRGFRLKPGPALRTFADYYPLSKKDRKRLMKALENIDRWEAEYNQRLQEENDHDG